MPSTPGTPAAMASSTAAIAFATTSRSSLIRVGSRPGGPEAPVRRGDGRHAAKRRLVVEEDAPASVDLQVDETGQEVAGELYDLGVGSLLARQDGADSPRLDQHGSVALEAVGRQKAAGR
jgi:hypothetical protein